MISSSITSSLPPKPAARNASAIRPTINRKPSIEPRVIPTTAPGAGPLLRPAYVVGMTSIWSEFCLLIIASFVTAAVDFCVSREDSDSEKTCIAREDNALA